MNSMLYTDSFISHDISFNPAFLKTNYGIVFDRSKIKYAYMFDEILRVINDEEYDLVDNEGKKLYDENGKEIKDLLALLLLSKSLWGIDYNIMKELTKNYKIF